MKIARTNQNDRITTGMSACRCTATPGGYAPGRMARAGFTLVEMFVVIAIILIIVALAVPGVSAMAYSSNRALAENSLRVGVGLARDAAIASSRSGDGAAVFLFDPGGQIRIVPAEVVGQIRVAANPFSLGSGGIQTYDVLAPIALGQSITLPASWMVRGYAPPGSMDARPGEPNPSWYTSRNYGGTSSSDIAKREGNWIFPESGFYDIDLARHAGGGGGGAAGFSGPPTPRQSFMVRFSSRTGGVSRVSTPGLFIDPRPSTMQRELLAMRRSDPTAWKRVDWAEDARTWGVRALGRLGALQPGPEKDEILRLLGNNSNDTVLVKSVNRLALYDERRLARGIGGRVNQSTGSIYETYRSNSRISFDQSLFNGADTDQIRRNINAWIDGDTSGGPGGPLGDIYDDRIDENDSPESKLFTLQGYTGELTEIEQ